MGRDVPRSEQGGLEWESPVSNGRGTGDLMQGSILIYSFQKHTK